MMKIRTIKIIEKDGQMKWWQRAGFKGEILPVIEVSSDKKNVKVEFSDILEGWLSLSDCEINPHLKLIK